jgi:hypothetical protein
MRHNISIDTDPQQQKAASPQCVVALSSSRNDRFGAQPMSAVSL